MSNTAQIKRVLLILLFSPLAAVLLWAGLTTGVDLFVNQKRIGKTPFYLIYNHYGIVVLAQKDSFLSLDYTVVSGGYVSGRLWDDEHILFSCRALDNKIKEYKILSYHNSGTDDYRLFEYPDAEGFQAGCDSLGCNINTMTELRWRVIH